MWRLKYVLGLALALSVCGGVAWAGEVDLSGKWTLSMEGESPSAGETKQHTHPSPTPSPSTPPTLTDHPPEGGANSQQQGDGVNHRGHHQTK